jgi:hypothetical protein
MESQIINKNSSIVGKMATKLIRQRTNGFKASSIYIACFVEKTSRSQSHVQCNKSQVHCEIKDAAAAFKYSVQAENS